MIQKRTKRMARTAIVAALMTLSVTATAQEKCDEMDAETVTMLLEKADVQPESKDVVRMMPLRIMPGATHFLKDCHRAEGWRATPVSRGVFGLTDDGVTYTLYNINGYALSDDREWCVTSMGRIPEMGFPGVLLHKTAKGLTVPDGTQLYLVDQHGIAKPMPPKYVDATNFVDGLCAIATKVDGMVADWHFMDTGLREVYPSIKTYPKQVGGKNYTIAPLRENRRAVYVAENAFSGAWGYLGADGRMVIQPQYSSARSFSSGLALVSKGDFGDDFFFIDLGGAKRFEPKKTNPNLVDPQAVSDYAPRLGICTVAPMQNDNDEDDGYYAHYYNASGNSCGKALWGTPFIKSNAYARKVVDGEERTCIVTGSSGAGDVEVGAVSEVDFHTAQWGTPWVDDGGVMHYSAQLTDNGIGVGSQYPMSWEVGDFSADGYATASIMSPNGMMKFTGIINRQGIFVVVYQIEGGEE